MNPLAGIGGAVGLKGSDGSDIVAEAFKKGAVKHASERMEQTLRRLTELSSQLELITFAGEMGELAVINAGLKPVIIGALASTDTTAEDTLRVAKALVKEKVDLILFAGGDGTARNLFDAIGADQLVLGVPAGVKIHSGVYAVNCHAAAEVVCQMLSGDLVAVGLGEVRDIDEVAFRQGKVQARFYGEMLVPMTNRYLQHVKCGGREQEELVLEDIAAGIDDVLKENVYYIIGPGTTTRAIMDFLGLENTLLGVDVILNRTLVGSDVTEAEILQLISEKPACIIVTPIGGQGHIFGRGNHQISPAVIREVGKGNIIVVATKTKLSELEGRPLLVDTFDQKLNEELRGFQRVVTGFQDEVIYKVES